MGTRWIAVGTGCGSCRLRNLLQSIVLLPWLCATLSLLGPPPAHARGQLLLWPEGSTRATFGPNEAITIGTGVMRHVQGCSPGGIDDFISPWTSVYIVPSGSVRPGDALSDVGGVPNSVEGAAWGIFVSETIGFTEPGGAIGPGTYAVVYDECQNGRLDPIDGVFDPAFDVLAPLGIPQIDEEIARLKSAAAAESLYWADVCKSHVINIQMLSLLDSIIHGLPGVSGFLTGGGGSFGSWLNQKIIQIVAASAGLAGQDPVMASFTNCFNMFKHYAAIANDPPDPQFQETTPLEPRARAGSWGRDPLAAAWAAVADASADEAAVLGAFLSALERYQGARDAGDAGWALIHARALQGYADLLRGQLGRTSSGLSGAVAALSNDPRPWDEISAELEALRSRLETSGLTPEEREEARNLGFSDIEIDEMIAGFVAQDFAWDQNTLLAEISQVIDANAQLQNALALFSAGMVEIAAGLEADPRVPDTHPVADAGGPYLGVEGQPLSFDGTSSRGPRAIVSYEWDLDGDGEFDDASGPGPSYVYSAPFHGIVGLRVTDETGAANVAYAFLDVAETNRAPRIDAVSPVPRTVELFAGDSQVFEVSVSDPEGDAFSVEWMVDGVFAASGEAFGYLTSASDVGIRWIEAIATDADPLGGSVRVGWIVSVSGARLPNLVVSSLTASDLAPARGANVSLSARVCNTGRTGVQDVAVRFTREDPAAGPVPITPDITIPSLAADACKAVTSDFDTTGLEGSQLVYAAADPDDAKVESDETDNRAALAIQIQEAIANLPPEILSDPITTGTVTAPYAYRPVVVDPDGDPLAFEGIAGPAGMAINPATGELRWIPQDYDAGSHEVAFRVRDGRGGTAEQRFTLTVEGNRRPEFTSSPVTAAALMEPYIYEVTATDPDGETVTFSLGEAPQGMTIHPQEGTIRWIPAPGQEGIHNVVVRAVDERGGEARQAYTVRVPSSQARPDLVVVGVDNGAVSTDPQALSIRGAVGVTVGNAGPVDVTARFRLLVFHDRSGDGLFTDGEDPVLGEATLDGLPALETASVSVPVSGTLRFRGDLIHAWVDSGEEVAEADETNNVGHSGRASAFRPEPGPFTPELEWSWPASVPEGELVMPEYDDVMTTPLVVNLTDDNGDGVIDTGDVPDVVFVTTCWTDCGPQEIDHGILRAVSGKDGSPLWDLTDPAFRVLPYHPIAAGDLDGDGLVEIVARHVQADRLPIARWPGYLIVENDGTPKGMSVYNTNARGNGVLSIADLDGDGSPEIVDGKGVSNADGSLSWTGSKCFGARVWRGDFSSAEASAVADLDLDGRMELITGPVAYRADGSIYYDISVPIGTSFRSPWDPMPCKGGHPAVGNFDDDPYPEIVVAERVVVLLDHLGNVIWQTGDIDAAGPPAVADLDGDGLPEIAVAGSAYVRAVDHDGTLMWSFPIQDASGYTGATVFDFEGDGNAEVVYQDENYLRVFRGTDGAVLFQVANPSGTRIETPVVADVDNDGRAEIVVARNQMGSRGWRTGTFDAGIFVYGDRWDRWIGTRRIWNQDGYYITNVNEDGTIPPQETPNWQVFNNFRVNEPVPEEENDPHAAPDLTASLIRVDETGCPDTATLTARIGNGGGDVAPAGVPVSFYDGDPDAGAPRIGTAHTTQVLGPGEFEDVSVTFDRPADGPHRITAVADDGENLTESENLLGLEGVRVVSRDNLNNPLLAFDTSLGTAAQPAATGGAAVLELEFPFPVNVRSIRALTYYEHPSAVTVTFPDGDEILSDVDHYGTGGIFAAFNTPPGFRERKGVTRIRFEFSGTTTTTYIRDIRIQGSYVDPDRRGIVAEGREDNNRTSHTVGLCGNAVPENSPPEILSAAVTEAVQGIPYRYDVKATDLDGDPLEYVLAAAPEGMAVDAATGRISWMPQPFQQGSLGVTLEVRDGRGGVAVQEYSIDLRPVDRPPEITSAPPTEARVGEVYAYDVEATDPEGEPLRYALEDAPAGMSIDGDTGLVRWRPALSQVGSHRVTVRVRDLGGASADQTFTLVVLSGTAGPDLVVSQVDNLPSVTDIQTLALGGRVAVTFGNAGDAPVSGTFELILFADGNGNGAFDPDVDSVLGSATHGGGMAGGQYLTYEIEVAGTVAFRDDLIYAFVDSGGAVAEADETNNVRATGASSRHRGSPDAFSVEEERSIRPPNGRFHSIPLVANLNDDNGDGRIDEEDVPEIVFMDTWNTIRVYDGASGDLLWSWVNSGAPPYWRFDVGTPAVGDVDGDGFPEILAPTIADWGRPYYGQRMIVLDHEGNLETLTGKWRGYLGGGAAVHIANIDRQGLPEILVGNVILNGDGTLRCQGSGAKGDGGSISVAVDLDLAGDLEVVAGNTAYRSDCSILWQNPNVPDGRVSVADLDDDPYPEIVLVGTDNQVRVLEHDGTLKAGPVTPPGVGTEGIHGLAVLADFDGDGAPEIAVAAGSVVSVLDPADLSVVWTRGLSTVTGAPAAFDLEGDGSSEVLISSMWYRNPTFYILSGRDGSIRYTRPVWNAHRGIYPVVADVDRDGNAEIVLHDPAYGIRILGERSDEWVGTRPVWNQYAYHVTNVNDDGSIPVVEPNPALLDNSFLQNPPKLLAPDITASRIVVDGSACPDAVEVTARIGNGGGAPVAAGVPVTFFDGDPYGNGRRIGQVETSRPLSPGEYEDVAVTLEAPEPGVHRLTVVADLETEVENLALLPGVTATASSEYYQDSAYGAIDGKPTVWCTKYGVPSSHLQVHFPFPVDVDRVTMTHGTIPSYASPRFASGRLVFSNGSEIPVTLSNGGGAFDIPVQEGVTWVRFEADGPGCFSEFVPRGVVSDLSGLAEPPPDETMVAHWPLDGSAADATGNGHDGEVRGGPQTVPGLTTPALEFDGRDDALVVDGFADMPSDRITVSLWMKAGDEANRGTLVSYRGGWAGDGLLRIENPTNLRVCIHNACFDTGIDVSDGGWHHIALTSEPQGNSGAPTRLYVDGRPAGSWRVGGMITQGGDLALGYLRSAVSDTVLSPTAFKGVLDDVRIYDRVLTPAQVAREYQQGMVEPRGDLGRVGEGREDNNAASVAVDLCTDANRPPAITSAPISSGVVGDEYAYPVEASDPDGDPLGFTLVIAPEGMAVDGATGEISWTPGPDQVGHHPVAVQASDGRGGLDLQSFTVTVAPAWGMALVGPADADGDGIPGPLDCDDADPKVLPGVSERPGNGKDDDCDLATADAVDSGQIVCSVTTDAAVYREHERVGIAAVVENTTTDTIFVQPVCAVSVRDPAGAAVHADQGGPPALPAGASVSVPFGFDTGTLRPGVYDVDVVVRYGDVAAASCGTTFSILSSLEAGTAFEGTISALPAEIDEGETTQLHYAVTNAGNVDAPDVDLGVEVLRLATGDPVARFTERVSLARGASVSGGHAFVAGPVDAGEYLAVLTAAASPARALAGARFTVLALDQPPVADAGPDRNVPTGEETVLDGSGAYDPEGAILAYEWGLEQKPSASSLTEAGIRGRHTPRPAFTPDVEGTYVFRLVVDDGGLPSEADTVAITAFASDVPPNADAGPDRWAVPGELVVLDGSRSHDPDQAPQPLTYRWSLVSSPSGSTAGLTGADAAAATFVPDAAGTYEVSLEVSDGLSADEDRASVRVSDPNVPPNADAGPDVSGPVGQEAVLDGSGSYDPDDGPEPLEYLWRFVSVPAGSTLGDADIADADTAAARFVPDAPGVYVLRLEVRDGLATAADNAAVEATAPVPTQMEPIADLAGRGKLDKVSLTWTCVPDAEAYNVYRGTTPGGPYDRVAEGHVTDYCTYLDTGLVTGQTYYYVVTWTDGRGAESSASNEAAVTPATRRRRR